MPSLHTRPATTLLPSWRVLALILVSALIWVAHFDRWTAASWQLPTDYTGDTHETLARLKAASEGSLRPLEPQVIERLGAPFGAHWNAYPTPDKPLMVLLGQLVPVIGVNATANLGYLLAQISATLSFYFVARWFRCRASWAAAGALLFAFSYHTFHRGLAHFSLIFTWTVPLGLLAVWLVARSQRLEWKSRGTVVCLVAALALGISNPYNLFFWLQLMAWALLAGYFSQRRGANLQIGLVAVLVAIVGFLTVNAEVWLHVEDSNAPPLLARNYGGTEQFALKPVEMFIPPEFHRWGSLAFFGHRYVRWSAWRGEIFLPYLGLVGITAFAFLSFLAVRSVLLRKQVPGQALTIAWLVAFSTIGGITNLLAFFAQLQVFRATNRVAIFISALLLVFAVVRLSRWTARWPRWLSAAAALGVAALGVADEVPRPETPREAEAIAAAVGADAEFGRELEAALPRGAMVFQLPVLGFPEVVPPYRLDSYEHFRPYLATEHLRFSYGTPKFRSRIRWQRELERMPAREMVRTLEAYGFSALYLNRKGFADHGRRLVDQLAAIGYRRSIESPSGNQVAILLHPAAVPLLPTAHSFSLGHGWLNQPDGTTRWAYDDASLSYYNPYAHPVSATVDLAIRGATPRELTLTLDGNAVRRFPITTQTTHVSFVNLKLHPGLNCLLIRSDSPPVRLSDGPNQLRSFGLVSSSVHLPTSNGPATQYPDTMLAGPR